MENNNPQSWKSHTMLDECYEEIDIDKSQIKVKNNVKIKVEKVEQKQE